MGFNGAVAIDFLATDKIMKYLGVAEEERLDFFEKVSIIQSEILKMRAERAERDAKNK